MTRKVAFWIAFVAVSAATLAFAIANFSRSFAVISLPLAMDRATAVRTAQDLATRHALGPGGAVRTAAQFALDDTVKTFLELEGGGTDAFQAMLRDHRYEAYTWAVRVFREGETRELLVRFRPDGRPYGFVDHLREDAAGARLPADSARAIAEAAATRDWGLDLSHYAALPASTEIRPGGRADHTFTYERRDVRAGDGVYRVRLVVAGDRLTELTHYLRVPEAFSRTYARMRTSNDAIALTAQVLMVLLFIVGGCIVGVFLLMRRRELEWTPAVTIGFGIAALQALAMFNDFPLAWMSYDTAISGATFVTRQVMFGLLTFVADGCLVALTLAAAEGLGRRAFPHHPQLWRTWSRDAVASRSVVGRTLGGTVLTGFEFGYIIAFYLVATRLWKWWTPAEALVDPNVLSTYVPWLSAVAPSLHAGFWEEAMFRAVPLAGAALLGDRLGNRRLWIGIGLVAEALIFGGSHANYASWPAYSRPVELIVPSLIWGFVYLRFGLVPSIITHYLFDLSLFSLPLFASTAANARVDQVAIVVCAAVPLLVIAVALARQRGMTELPDALRNGAWTPPAAEPEAEAVPVETPVGAWPATRTRAIVALGAIGLVAWAVFGKWTLDAPALRTPRATALATGLRALESRDFVAGPQWKRLVTTDDDDVQGVFVWRTSGPETYRAIAGRDLVPPHWVVRLARFHAAPAAGTRAIGGAGRDTTHGRGAASRMAAGALATAKDVAERAEEWQAWVTGDGRVWRARHVLPDARPGAALDVAAARALADGELRARFAADATRLVERSAVPTAHPARTDWTFTFADTVSAPRLRAGGERRIVVEIAGDRVTDAHRIVFVPEDWQRGWRREGATLGVLNMVRILGVVAIAVLAAALGIMAWSRGMFPVRLAVGWFALSVAIGTLGAIDRWPVLEARLNTASPVELQLGMVVIAILLGQLVIGAVFALIAGWSAADLVRAPGRVRTGALVGPAVAALGLGILSTVGHFSTASEPLLGEFGAAQALLPWADPPLQAAQSMLMQLALVVALFALARRASYAGKWAGWALLFVGGGLLLDQGASSATEWLVIGACSGIALVALDLLGATRDPRFAPGLVAATAVMGATRGIVRAAFPGAPLANALAIVVIVAITAWWLGRLGALERRDAAAGAGTYAEVAPAG